MTPPPDRNVGQRSDARWLDVVKKLMVGVKPKDYIWSADPRLEAQRLVFGERWRAAVRAMGSAALILVTVAVMHLLGYRQITPRQERALRVVAQVDPDFEVDDASVLAKRWGQHAEAYRLVRIATAPADPQATYPYLADLSGHPAPSASPGNGIALVELAEALDRYPATDTRRLIDRLLAVAASMDRVGVVDAIEKVAHLSDEARINLFAGTSDEFVQRINLQAAVNQEQGAVNDLNTTLQARQTALQFEKQMLQQRLSEASTLTKRDQHRLASCKHYLNTYIK